MIKRLAPYVLGTMTLAYATLPTGCTAWQEGVYTYETDAKPKKISVSLNTIDDKIEMYTEKADMGKAKVNKYLARLE